MTPETWAGSVSCIYLGGRVNFWLTLTIFSTVIVEVNLKFDWFLFLTQGWAEILSYWVDFFVILRKKNIFSSNVLLLSHNAVVPQNTTLGVYQHI